MFKVKKSLIGKAGFRNHAGIQKFIFSAVIITILLVPALFLTSCFPSGSEAEQTEQRSGQETSGIIEEEAAEEAAEDITVTAEEPPELLDYQNLQTGAEMVGYIPSALCTGKDNYIRIDITNTSEYPWRNKRPGVVRIGYHYYGQDVDFVDYDKTSRTEFPDIVEPGETVSVNVLINDIANPGYYIIQIDPVIEGNEIPEDNFWFSSKGVKMIEGLCYFNSCTE